MSPRALLGLSFALAGGLARGVTFYAAPSAASAPKFTWGGGVATRGASIVGDAYAVDGLPFAMPKSGNFAWDFYAVASPGQTLTSVTIAFVLSGAGSGARWASTTAAKVVEGGSEWSVPSRTTGLASLGATVSQTIDLSSYGKAEWRISATDTFVLPAGMTVASIEARATEAAAQTVPEPASFAALGLGAFGLLRRRRR